MKSKAMERARYRTARMTGPGTLSYWYRRAGESWQQHVEHGTLTTVRALGVIGYAPDAPAPELPQGSMHIHGITLERGEAAKPYAPNA